jgi:hypothetical protein
VTDAITSGLLLAVISAIVFVAYQHPTSYSRLYMPVRRLLGFGTLVTMAWALGDSEVRGKVRVTLPTALADDRAAQESLRAVLDDAPPYGWILLGLAATFVFLEALSALPRYGIVGDRPNTAQPGPTTPTGDHPRIEDAPPQDARP